MKKEWFMCSKQKAAIFVSVFFMFLFSGCTAGHDYIRPEASTPEKWTALDGNQELNISKNAEITGWWKNFNDPVLTSLVEKAAIANHDVKIAESRLRQSRALKKISIAGLWPESDAKASYKKSGYENVESDTFQAGIDASWEIDIFGLKRRDVEAADADTRAAEEDIHSVLVSLSAEIATDYLNLKAIREQIDLAKKNIRAQREIVAITEKQFDAGLATRLDFTSAKAQISTAEAKIPELEAVERELVYSLGVLTSEGTSVLSILSVSGGKNIPPAPPVIPAGLPSELLERRPDILKAEAQLHAATARTGAAKAEYFPKFSLTGSFGYSASESGSLFNWNSRSWGFGPAVSIPLFNAGKIAAIVEVKTELQEQALETYRKTVLEALKDVETALYSYSRNIKRHESLVSAAKENFDAAEMAVRFYSAGKVNYIRALEARRTLYSSQEAVVQSNGKLAVNLVSLYKALGGGWKQYR